MKSMIKQKPWIRDYLLIFIGTALMSIALKSAFDTNGIVDGGFSGIAIIVKSVTEPLLPGGIPLGVTNLLLNIPMLVSKLWASALWQKPSGVRSVCLSG